MNQRNAIHEELKAIDAFWSQPYRIEAPYSVPHGYFNHLNADILSASRNGAIVPQSPDGITPAIAPVPAGLPAPYAVPDHYFEELGPALLAMIKEREKPKSTTLTVTRQLFRYAAAAALLGVILGVGWMFRSEQRNTPNNLSATVALMTENIGDEELVQFLNLESPLAVLAYPDVTEESALIADAVSENLLTNFTDSELEEFISNPTESIPNLMN